MPHTSSSSPHDRTQPFDGRRIHLQREASWIERVVYEMKSRIVGQDRVLERVLVCLLAGGHCLLEGVPGVAKTYLVRTLATVVGGSFSRIQFTPDLVPADIVGTRIFRAATGEFETELGPVFANFVLADEINRAPAKVQSALLEVMAEHQVSIGGRTHRAPEPFLVLATQNPIESEGVYELPEAQRDRFLMRVNVAYPSLHEELEIVRRASHGPIHVDEVLTARHLVHLQQVVASVYVDPGVLDYAVRLVVGTRAPAELGLPDLAASIAFGAGPRASIGVVAAARGLAVMRGRGYVLPGDVRDIAADVLRHRIVLSYDALAAGLTPDDVLGRLIAGIPRPEGWRGADRVRQPA